MTRATQAARVATTPAPADEAIVRARGLVKRYGRFTALDDVSLEVRRGEIFGILGPNGAGKTTLLEILEGLRAADAGEAQVDGLDVRRKRRAVQQRIGVQLQATTLFEELTARETVALFASFYPRALDPDALLREVALEEKADIYPQLLSGGQRQRLALALALVNDPTLVFLDEPTTGLDPQSRRLFWETILRLRERGKTLVLTTHFMDEAQTLCDRIAILDAGRVIAQDTPAGLIGLLGASATIECAVGASATGQPPVGPEEVRALPGVTEARAGTERLLIYTEQVERTLVALLQLATARGATVEHLHVHAPTLEDVFLKLTGHALRE
ncbi:MAG: ABC transporter ATP-binding protein [Ktedonobacterales bacterium]|nr:ABC transporter ATP-binding protein [Ktedonobacterales bacterium]